MRLVELLFERVGHWRDLSPLRLGRRVTLVLGDNEAGKSTAMRAIEMLLFGGAHGDGKQLVAPLPSESRFTASAIVALDDGTEVRLRRHGRKLDGEQASPELAASLDSAHAGRFRDLFRIDHARLRADGGFLAEKGALGRVVFAATAGASAADLSRIEGELRKRRDKASSGAKGTDGLKVRLESYQEAKDELRARPRFDVFDDAAAEVERLREQATEATREVERIGRQAERLGRLAGGLVEYEQARERELALAALAAEGAIPDAEWPTRADELAKKVREAEGAVASAEQEAGAAARALEESPLPSPIVDYAAEIDDAARAVEGLGDRQRELAIKREELREARGRLSELVLLLGGASDAESLVATATSLVLPAPRQKALAEAIEEGSALALAERSARETLVERRSDLERLERRSSAAPRAPVATLERARPLVERLVALTKDGARARETSLAERAKARALAVELGLAGVADEALASVPVAAPDVIERLGKALTEARAAVSSAVQVREVADKDRGKWERTLASLSKGPPAPTRAELDEARASRERAFDELSAEWTPTLKGGAAEVLPALASAYARTVREADGVADRRFDAAQRLGELEAARAELSERRRVCEEAANEEAARRVEAEGAEREWGESWEFCAAPPSNAETWLVEHRQMLGAIGAAERAAGAATDCDVERGRLRRDLVATVEGELPSIARIESDEAIRAELERELARRHELNKAASELEAKVAAVRDLIDEAERAVEKTTNAHAEWRRGWGERCAALPPSVGAEPAAVETWLAAQKELKDLVSTAGRLERDVAARAEAIGAAEARVRELLARVCQVEPELSVLESLGARDAVHRLVERAKVADRRKREREDASDEHERCGKALDKGIHRLAAHRAELLAAWRAAGLSGEPAQEELDRARDRARAADGHRRAKERIEAGLAAHWTMGIEAALAEITGRSVEELWAAQAERLSAREACVRRRDECHGAYGAAKATLDALGASSGDGGAAQRLAFARARVFERADEVVLLDVATWLLAKAKERAAERAQPILDRASKMFSALTEGAYEGLTIDRDGAEPTLVAVQAEHDKAVSELSDGTCDAIWLALRLAVVEEAARQTPFPLLLDDVFVHLDDRRTVAALRVLASLSERVQVILFTHHDHVLDLARGALGEDLTEIVLTTPEAGERVRLLQGPRTRHERPPAPIAATIEALEMGPSTSHDEARDAVLAVLRESAGPMGKGDIVEAAKRSGVDVERAWSAVLARLKDERRVVQTGDRRGARYSLVEVEGGSP